MLALGYLAGPLRVEGWKGAVASLNRTKAGLLLRQCEAIAQASKLEGLEFRRVPYPGRIVGPHGELTILSADRGAGHAESLDLVLCDETGLMFERDREMLASLVSSTSAKDGRVIHLSIRGDGPFVPELLQDADVFRMVYAAPDRCEVNDRAAWRAANPGLGTIKSRRLHGAGIAGGGGRSGERAGVSGSRSESGGIAVARVDLFSKRLGGVRPGRGRPTSA